VGLLPKEGPKETRTFAFVVVKEGLGVKETFFGGNGADAQAANVFEAAAFDQVSNDVEGLSRSAVLPFTSGIAGEPW
jgi:hypothetical protein